jgi:hypothetical protein
MMRIPKFIQKLTGANDANSFDAAVQAAQ